MSETMWLGMICGMVFVFGCAINYQLGRIVTELETQRLRGK